MAFGPGPVLVLFAPFLFVTGSYLPDALGCAALALGAYVFGCLALRLFLRKLFPTVPAWVLPLLCLGFGFCNAFSHLLRRPAVYETAIAGGQFFLMAAVWLLGRVLLGESRRSDRRRLPRHRAQWAIGMTDIAEFSKRPELPSSQ